MADWIDRRKKADQEREQSRRVRQETLLRKTDILRAKLPFFVQTLRASIKRDAAKLLTKYPDNRKYRCNLEERGEYTFAVRNEGTPHITIELEFNVDAQLMLLRQSIRRSPLDPTVEQTEKQFTVSIDDDGELSFSNGPYQYGDADEMSELMLTWILNSTA